MHYSFNKVSLKTIYHSKQCKYKVFGDIQQTFNACVFSPVNFFKFIKIY
jgi:hypothetical protein